MPACLISIALLLATTLHASRLSRDPVDFIEHGNYIEEQGLKLDPSRHEQQSVVPITQREDKDFCTTKAFRRWTLKLVRESPFVGLIHDLQNQTRFEASDLVMLHGNFYIVFDNIRTIARVDARLGDFSDPLLSALIPEHLGDPDEESQFEGISFIQTRNTFLILRESILHPIDGQLHPQLEEIKISTNVKKDYTVVRRCVIDFDLESDNKGFEGLHYFQGPNKEDMALGLCESNYCKSNSGPDAPGKDPGNGRLVLARYHSAYGDTECMWTVDKVISIPTSAYFVDYSGFAFGVTEDGQADVAIVSQEDSAVWIGRWDWKMLDFASDDGQIWHLPRDNNCDKLYCNVEGVQFIDKMRLALVSDRCKGAQSYTCHGKDQSIHVFALAS